MISTITYNGDGVTRVFPVSFEIKGEAYVVTYINDVAVADKTKYDIINNSIVFVEGEAPVIGIDNVQIVVASTPTEIADLNAPPSSVQTVLDNLTDITTVANNLVTINTVSDNITSINTINTNIVPNITEILQADNNATIASTKAAEAVVSADNASSSATDALASENKAFAWSSTPENTQVETGLYSALHWADKAQEWASTVDTNNFVDKTTDQTVGGIKTFSSFPIAPSSSPTTNYQVVNKIYIDSNFVDKTTDQTVGGIKTFSSFPITPSSSPTTNYQMANKIYVDTTVANGWVANDSRAKTALNAKGAAPIYACRAWVNFNGTGTVAISGSGNVSSITDNGVGDYTVNFTTAMTDVNYSCVGVTSRAPTATNVHIEPQIYSTSSIRLVSALTNSDFTLFDTPQISVVILR